MAMLHYIINAWNLHSGQCRISHIHVQRVMTKHKLLRSTKPANDPQSTMRCTFWKTCYATTTALPVWLGCTLAILLAGRPAGWLAGWPAGWCITNAPLHLCTYLQAAGSSAFFLLSFTIAHNSLPIGLLAGWLAHSLAP